MADITNTPRILRPTRRAVLAGAGAFVAWSQMPAIAQSEGRDPRLVVVILRGALDGLAAVPPIGDPHYAALRGDLAVGAPGREPALALDGFFGLNDAMPNLHRRYQAGEALFVHATATPYRERSHFDGQDVLESGLSAPQADRSGWLNRAIAALPVAGRIAPISGLAVSPTVPLILRGGAPVVTWTPPMFRPAGPDTADRLLDLYEARDSELAEIFAAGMDLDAMAMAGGAGNAGGARTRNAFAQVADGAAKLLLEPEGPRIAVLNSTGWDTHANEGVEQGRLSGLLGALDSGLEAFAAALQPIWPETAVVVVTEFGRTVQENGTDGTDHGTGTIAILLGGAIAGGRVIADWPGLRSEDLLDGRDLNPTIDLRAVLQGVLHDHLGLSERVLADAVFPGSLGVRPMSGLMA